jgi:HK97 family phage major capsid protein
MIAIDKSTIELRNNINELERLSTQPELSTRDRARYDFLAAKVNPVAPSKKSTEELRQWLNHLPSSNEIRSDILAGSQTIAYSVGSSGGYLVPQEFNDQIILGMAQYDPLLNENIITLKKTDGGNPLTIPAWDLSTFAAQLISEGSQQTPQTPPPTSGRLLNGYIFRASLDASIEFEEDTFTDTMNLMRLAYSIGFSRSIGQYLATGSGVNQPSGILTGATFSGVTLDQTITTDVSNTLADKFLAAYFSVNRIYRASPKCAWVCSDETYMWLRSLSDKQARPLINIVNDRETILGKPVFISPSIPSYSTSPLVVGKLLFGDLSHFVARISPLSIQRRTQAPGYAENFKALYVSLARCDGALIDPTDGNYSPVTYTNINP